MSKYDRIIEYVFQENYHAGARRVNFDREELASACDHLGIARIKNLGDIPYSFRFRRELPDLIKQTAPDDSEWIIVSVGISKYAFRQASPPKIEPSAHRQRIKVPDSTPEIVKIYASGMDEQALLTKICYNRLVDLFTGLTCYSIQNHLRTTVVNVGQIEIDEIYLGINKRGAHFIIPCQAKSPGDKFSIVQIMQDIAFCNERYPNVRCKPIALQFLTRSDVAILELSVEKIGDVFILSVVDEKHYTLVAENQISDVDIKRISDAEV